MWGDELFPTTSRRVGSPRHPKSSERDFKGPFREFGTGEPEHCDRLMPQKSTGPRQRTVSLTRWKHLAAEHGHWSHRSQGAAWLGAAEGRGAVQEAQEPSKES